MNRIKFLIYLLFINVFISCWASAGNKSSQTSAQQSSETEKTITERDENFDLINTVYHKFVFAKILEDDVSPERYFTADVLTKLQEDYAFDCDNGPCYAYYALRTDAQDSRPGSDGASIIQDIEPTGDGWYTVTYSDMGWPGKTRIKVYDRKIVDYKRME